LHFADANVTIESSLFLIEKEVFGLKFFCIQVPSWFSIIPVLGIALLLSAFTHTSASSRTYASNFPVYMQTVSWPDDMIEYDEIATREEGLEMEGRIPALNANASAIQSRINTEIEQVIDDKITRAREGRARVLTFDYEIYFSAPHMSILLKSTATAASSKTEVISINFNVHTGALVSASDVVGPYVVQLADRLLLEMIRRNPDHYNPAFTGMQQDQAFSITNREITFWFDEFQLAPGYEGIVSLSLRLSNIKTVTLSADALHIRSAFNLKMIPLHIVEDLGYVLTWNNETNRASIYYNDELIIELTPGYNDYVWEHRFTRSLEVAPEIIVDRTYVPISFFDQILSLIAYSIDDDGNITFASYPVEDPWFER